MYVIIKLFLCFIGLIVKLRRKITHSFFIHKTFHDILIKITAQTRYDERQVLSLEILKIDKSNTFQHECRNKKAHRSTTRLHE